LESTIVGIGSDRVMFSVDYRYKNMQDAADWFDASLLSYNDRRKVGGGNAERVFGIESPSATTRLGAGAAGVS
jgi:gamma-resorcylate decarboxylase